MLAPTRGFLRPGAASGRRALSDFCHLIKPKIKVVCVLLFLGSIFYFLLLSGTDESVLAKVYSAELPSPTVEIIEPSDNPATISFLLANSNSSSSLGADNITTLCPATPPGLVGPIRVFMDAPTMETLEKLYGAGLEVGGHGRPEECVARDRVAIIVPYREREEQLRMLLHNLHSLLRKQLLDYGIYVMEQSANATFNRAKLMNVGYVEALKDYSWTCFVFHDVDLLPEDDRNMYSCSEQPRHMSVAIDKFNYQLPYGSIFGGISALSKAHVKRINGFSNDYWGWGGEDDDLSTRVNMAGFKIARYPSKIARYKMIRHMHEKKNPVNECRYKLMAKTKKRWQKDGLNNLKYKVLLTEKPMLYTRVLVDLLEAEAHEELAQSGFPGC